MEKYADVEQLLGLGITMVPQNFQMQPKLVSHLTALSLKT